MKYFCTLFNRNLFKKLKRSFLLTAFVVLCVNMAQAQAPRLSLQNPDLPNSEDNPYVINSAADWGNFVLDINDGYAYYDAVNKKQQYVKLKKHISVTTMAGTADKKFKGIFDGNCDTLTFTFTNKASDFSGPFCFIDGVIIKNLYVDGTITTNKKHAGGIAGKASGTNTIINCTSNITINCTGAEGHGGFIGRQVGGTTQFEKCLFYGEINGGTDGGTTVKCAGFIGWLETERANYDNNCLMAGTITIQKNYSTFHRTINGKTTCNGKYTKNLNIGSNNTGGNHTNPGPNGFPANTTYTGIARKYKVGEVNYYAQVDIDDLNDMFLDTEHPLVITTNYYGKRLKEGEDYDVQIEKKTGSDPYQTISVGEMVADAQYRVTVTAKGDYVGSKTWEYKVLSENSRWSKLQELIDKAGSDPVVLDRDYLGTASDNALIIDKDLTINLNNHTINRDLKEPVENGQVIRISAGKNVTISNGTITGGYSRAKDDDSDPKTDQYDYKNDAGGIYNMGNLVLNNVHVVGNKCIKYTDKPTNDAATARGGGIYTGRGSSFTMNGGSVSYNIAKGGGGGVYCYMPASLSMKNVEISHNDSESKGGGLRIRTESPESSYIAILEDCRIENNRATEINLNRGSDGGGVYMQEGKLKMDGCTIGGAEGKGNQSAFAGAGFYQDGGKTWAKDCTISYNSAYTQHDRMYGGGLCVHAGTYFMDSGSIVDNHSYRDGGGVYIYQGAHFQVQGEVTITANLRTRPGAVPEDTDNNAYTADGAVIEIVGDITEDSKIHITGHGYGGTYTTGMEYHNVPDGVIEPDGKYQLVEFDANHQPYVNVRLEPYVWYQEGTWQDDQGHAIAPPDDETIVVVNKALELEPGEIGHTDYIRYVNGSIVLKDGSQLICKHGLTAGSPPVEALIQKNIKAYDSEDGGWYAISIPTDSVKIWDLWDHSTNLTNKESGVEDKNLDLLRYDEPHHIWDSYTDKTANNTYSWLKKFSDTECGRGYLYRYKEDRSLRFYGCIKLSDVTYHVTATKDAAPLTGWNIIGNPYCHTIYKGAGTAIPNGDLLDNNFYAMARTGAWIPKLDNTDSISVCEGILVHAIKSGDHVMNSSTSKVAPSKSDGEKTVKNSIKFMVANSKYEDIAYALFDNGTGLNKIDHVNEDIPMVYIHHNDANYAIASLKDNTKSFILCFNAKTLGVYNLKVNIEGEFKYLHLVDRLTGQDIDLLKENTYEFIGSSTDNSDRFIVRMSKASDSEEFAYQNGDDIIVRGDGELQIFDMLGRRVFTKYVSGVEAISKPSKNGVYILRLLGTDVKTQKIVVK